MFKYKYFLKVILPQRQKALIKTSRHIKQLFGGTLTLHDHDGKVAEVFGYEVSVFSNWGKERLSAMVFSISATSVERRF